MGANTCLTLNTKTFALQEVPPEQGWASPVLQARALPSSPLQACSPGRGRGRDGRALQMLREEPGQRASRAPTAFRI